HTHTPNHTHTHTHTHTCTLNGIWEIFHSLINSTIQNRDSHIQTKHESVSTDCSTYTFTEKGLRTLIISFRHTHTLMNHTHTYTHTHACIHTYTHAFTHVYIHTHTHTHACELVHGLRIPPVACRE